MNKFKASIIFAFLFSSICIADSDTGFPISIGDKSNSVKRLMGHRNRGDLLFDSYFKHGMVVQYSSEGFVVSISAGVFETGQQFGGEVFGVKIGDNISKAIELWGKPIFSENVTALGIDLGDKLYFQYKEYLIKVELWPQEDRTVRPYLKDTIRDIEIREFTNKIYGTWYSKEKQEYVIFSSDGSAKSCQKGKKGSLYAIHGNIKASGQVLWEGWKNNLSLYDPPDEWWSGSELYLVHENLVIEGMQKRTSYKSMSGAIPEKCNF